VVSGAAVRRYEPIGSMRDRSIPARGGVLALQRERASWLGGILASAIGCAVLAAGDSTLIKHAEGGKAVYEAACSACHGAAGQGALQQVPGLKLPSTFPRFNDCSQSTPEFSRDYEASIRYGGPTRGFSQIMPEFDGVLSARQIAQVIQYLRSLCHQSGWPIGDLNVPRALVTEKAFPESEVVFTMTVNTTGTRGITNEIDYEQAFGKRDQLEVALPYDWAAKPGGGLTGGLGDIGIGDKHVVFSRLNANSDTPAYEATGRILSIEAEVMLATGNQARGLGAGEPSLNLFAAYDELLPHQVFVQTQLGMDIPRHTEYGPRTAYFNTTLGTSVGEGPLGLGRLWSPMVEILGTHDLTGGSATQWSIVPEFQVTLNRRQHIRAAVGYSVPLNQPQSQSQQFLAYFLWDWFDGGLFSGW
jgi:mono/diheme cytochrome c family protein